jgi:hypothetical protein
MHPITRSPLAATLGALFLVLTFAPSARAADIFVNGKEVRGLTNLTIENCTVTFNTRGDIYISAPDLKVLPTAAMGDQVDRIDPPKGQQSFLKNRYFLFTQTTAPGGVPYRFEVWVNGTLAKDFSSAQEQLSVEITLFLKKGSNKVEIKSFYQAGTGGSPADSFSIFVGRGAPNAGSLEINKLLLNYTRKGNDSGDAGDVFHIDVE